MSVGQVSHRCFDLSSCWDAHNLDEQPQLCRVGPSMGDTPNGYPRHGCLYWVTTKFGPASFRWSCLTTLTSFACHADDVWFHLG